MIDETDEEREYKITRCDNWVMEADWGSWSDGRGVRSRGRAEMSRVMSENLENLSHSEEVFA